MAMPVATDGTPSSRNSLQAATSAPTHVQSQHVRVRHNTKPYHTEATSPALECTPTVPTWVHPTASAQLQHGAGLMQHPTTASCACRSCHLQLQTHSQFALSASYAQFTQLRMILLVPTVLTTASRACRFCHPSAAVRQPGVLLPHWPCPLLPPLGSRARSHGQEGRSCLGKTCAAGEAGHNNVRHTIRRAALQDAAVRSVLRSPVGTSEQGT